MALQRVQVGVTHIMDMGTQLTSVSASSHTYSFACPDIPPPLALPSTTQPSAEPLHHTLSTTSGFIHLTRRGANRPTGYVHAVRHH